MTRKVFWDDPYRTTLDAGVSRRDGDTIALDRTILYAFSGGQESDFGTIAGHPVEQAEWRDDGEIVYRLAPGHGLESGDAVELAIVWPRRHRLMRLHSAAEILLELAGRRLRPEAKVGAHIAADKARLDFQLDRPVGPDLPGLAEEANAMIDADLPILCCFEDEAAERRLWTIEGFARVPCCGTHVRSTVEIGRLALKRRNIGKGKERIEILFADEAGR
jgi:Ser-tRNA(Ala) deacylase AlaX